MKVTGHWDVDDPDVDGFVDASICSFAAWDLVIYLSRNPHTCESSTGLAVMLARQESDLMPALRRLVQTGVVLESDEAGRIHYRLTEDPAVREVAARFLERTARREDRLEFVRRVLAQMTTA